MTSLTVHCSVTAENGKRVPVTIEGKTTPTQLREQVATATKIPLSQLRLIFRGKMIKDNTEQDVVQEYKLENDCVLHCMGRPSADGNAAPAPAASVSAPSVTMAPNTTTPAAAPAPSADPLQAALDLLRTNAASPDVYTTAVTTLNKVLDNIVKNPMEEKYRKVKVQNAAFGKRLGNLAGGKQCMLAVGFAETTDEAGVPIYLMQASPEAWPALQAAKAKVEAAVADAKRVSEAATNTANAANPFGMPAAGGMGTGMGAGGMPGFGAGGMGGMPSGGMNNPMAQAAARNLMSNPQAMQQMLSNPMVQNMIQNDPNIPPHVRQTFSMLQQNPQMMSQLSQMMSDPTMRAQMEAAMQAGGAGMGGLGAGMGAGMGGLGGMGGGMPNMNNTTNNNNAPNNNNSGGGGANDQAQTEEEMIAEAIRRSLQDN